MKVRIVFAGKLHIYEVRQGIMKTPSQYVQPALEYVEVIAVSMGSEYVDKASTSSENVEIVARIRRQSVQGF